MKLAALRSERAFQFWKKGHEEQYSFNAAVLGEDCGGRAATRQGRAGLGGWSRESCSGGREGGSERRD